MKKKIRDNYLKVVEWSEEDQCYIGTSPGLIIGGVHGRDEAKVFTELCNAIDEAIELLQKNGSALPLPTTNKTYSGEIILHISPELHKTLAIKSIQEGENIDSYIQHKLEEVI